MAADVIVVGGGLVGLALARELHRQGLQVELFEAEGYPPAPAASASWAGAGMLAAYQTTQPALRPLAIAAARLYPHWTRELEQETALPSGYRPGGSLFLTDRGHAAPEPAPGGWQRLTPRQLTTCEPGLVWSGAAAWCIANDHSVDNRLLLAALLASLHRHGVAVRTHSRVEAVAAVPAGLAVTALGITHTARTVVNCAGAWAGLLPAPALAPVRPRKGQILRLRSVATPRHVIAAPGVYLVPRADGEVLVGATVEDAGFDTAVSPAVIGELRHRAEALLPALAGAELTEAWAGYRPCSPDELPLIGPTAAPGYWLAAGHFRDGILLAPITAKILARAIATGHLTRALNLQPFAPERFARPA
ncbi:MAG: FAD-dependent oxidoreductase, partial [Streptosporangiaceae bacterium]